MAADDEKKRKLRQRRAFLFSRWISCLHQHPHKLAPVCIGASSAEELGTGTQRRHDRQVLRGGSRPRCSSLTLQYRRGLLQLSVPLSVAACSRTLLLGQSVTRQVERDVVLHRACWQLLPVIPMPGEGLAHRRQPIFDPTAVFWRLQPGLELHILDSEQATIVELGTFFFKLEWRLFAAANPTSSSARVSLTSSSFSFLQPVVACCGAVSMRLQLNCKARFMLPCSCLAAEL